MAESNLFTMLSAYRPGAPASPFENYCTTGLAYFLQTGHRMLAALFAHATGISDPLAIVEVQPRLGDSTIADLLLTFEGGSRIIVDVQVEPAGGEAPLPPLDAEATSWGIQSALVRLALNDDAPAPWQPITWLQVVEALEDDPDPLARQYTQFVLQDILGVGDVPLDQAITTNRLYALGGAAIRRRFGREARYVNSASRPTNGRYRYLGTTFAVPGVPDMTYWVGIVNEAVPLSEHYHLMLASKETLIAEPTEQPRATGDWKWAHWTAAGRVVRPITAESYDLLLARLGD